jgi:hypothetical protein
LAIRGKIESSKLLLGTKRKILFFTKKKKKKHSQFWTAEIYNRIYLNVEEKSRSRERKRQMKSLRLHLDYIEVYKTVDGLGVVKKKFLN